MKDLWRDSERQQAQNTLRRKRTCGTYGQQSRGKMKGLLLPALAFALSCGEVTKQGAARYQQDGPGDTRGHSPGKSLEGIFEQSTGESGGRQVDDPVAFERE